MTRNPPDGFRAGIELCTTLKKAGFQAYLVGGAVRDEILGIHKSTPDLDVATDAKPLDLKNLFDDVHVVGKSFAVSLVKILGQNIEVATFRKDGPYSNHRHPDFINFGTKEEDAERRDFTINCIYWDLTTGEIWDPHHGLPDIDNKLLRCVGQPSLRFNEDALRIIRLFRFSSGLNFEIDPVTLNSALNAKTLLKMLSKDRIVGELKKVTNPWRFINTIHAQNLLADIFGVPILNPENFEISPSFFHDFTGSTLCLMLGHHDGLRNDWPWTRRDLKHIDMFFRITRLNNLPPSEFVLLAMTRILEQLEWPKIILTQIKLNGLLKDLCGKIPNSDFDTIKTTLAKINTPVAEISQKYGAQPRYIGVAITIKKLEIFGIYLRSDDEFINNFLEFEQQLQSYPQ